MTRPMLGWAALSRSALNRAEAQLTADAEGIRDEVGVLALHFGYANRFFPGTSVQQTRLRYALFVPWHLLALMRSAGLGAGQAAKALEQAEMDLARRLPDREGDGTIGRNTVKRDRPVSIPPSQSYWVALDQWGILRRVGDVAPGRREVLATLRAWREAEGGQAHLTDDEHRSLESRPRLFHQDLPEPPGRFTKGGSLDFTLTAPERAFLARRLGDVRRECDRQPALLSVLVQKGAAPSEKQRPWSGEIRTLADKADRAALERARDAAALSALARGVYLAGVEHLKDARDRRSSGTKHRDHLPGLVDRYRERALRLNLDDVALDGVYIGKLVPVLGAVQAWLRAGDFDPGDAALRKVLSDWEIKRKDRRARLPLNGHGLAARADWDGEKTGKAGPIGYRWDLVCRLLQDLHGAS